MNAETTMEPVPLEERPHGRLIRVANGKGQCSFLRVMIPYRLFDVGDLDTFERVLRLLDETWQLTNIKTVDLEEHVIRHVRDGTNVDDVNCSFAVYRPAESAYGKLRSPGWKMGTHKSTDATIPFKCTDVNLLVSLLGFAYLTFEVTPQSDDAGDLLDLAHRLRRVKAGAAPLLEVGAAPPATLEAVAEGLMSGVLGAGGERAAVGLAFPAYVGAFIDTAGLDDDARLALRQRVRRMFHRTQAVDPGDLDGDYRNEDRKYREGQWFFHSQDGGGFLAFDPPEDAFSRGDMSDHLRRKYFFGYEFALLQRHGLMSLSGRVADHWDSSDSSLEASAAAFRTIREQLLLFTARFRFSQIMSAQNQHADYRRWIEILEIERMHDEVRLEVHDMHGYLEELRAEAADIAREREQAQRTADAERSERRDRVFGLVAALFVIPSLVIGFLGINIDGVSTGDGLSIGAATAAVVVALAVGIGIAIGSTRVRPPSSEPRNNASNR